MALPLTYARAGSDAACAMQGAFAGAAFALDVGQMTPAPIKTQFGYHLIIVEGRR